MALKRRALAVFWLAVAGFGLAGQNTLAAPDPDRLRAAMIFNLTKFVRWPEESLAGSDTLRLCIVGKDSVTRHLSAVDGKKVNGRTLAVEQVTDVIGGCHVLVVGSSNVEANPSFGTLTVGRDIDFLATGGMISIDVENNRMVFDVNLQAARSQQLQISAEVLGLARSVRR